MHAVTWDPWSAHRTFLRLVFQNDAAEVSPRRLFNQPQRCCYPFLQRYRAWMSQSSKTNGPKCLQQSASKSNNPFAGTLDTLYWHDHVRYHRKLNRYRASLSADRGSPPPVQVLWLQEEKDRRLREEEEESKEEKMLQEAQQQKLQEVKVRKLRVSLPQQRPVPVSGKDEPSGKSQGFAFRTARSAQHGDFQNARR
ncbi:hypothetical protein K461DRAFT_131124 [Myriangium duriaei CBS 260.36]|uniref:Uncharacterized protein n=1 Tax=Myriangium duriaei CBS 260.36 TaxID=1168546 RepID=A0A9P4IZV8_9PEZI|nr:hypothetical protein K461DRAFT_131124 [Myriangium duriaei CBS 260.36]